MTLSDTGTEAALTRPIPLRDLAGCEERAAFNALDLLQGRTTSAVAGLGDSLDSTASTKSLPGNFQLSGNELASGASEPILRSRDLKEIMRPLHPVPGDGKMPADFQADKYAQRMQELAYKSIHEDDYRPRDKGGHSEYSNELSTMLHKLESDPKALQAVLDHLQKECNKSKSLPIAEVTYSKNGFEHLRFKLNPTDNAPNKNGWRPNAIGFHPTMELIIPNK